MDTVPLSLIREKLSVSFEHLPPYAGFLLHRELHNFVSALTALYEQSDVPLFKLFSAMDSHQRAALLTASTREMLTLMAANNAGGYIEKSLNNWLNNQLPLITREQVRAEDITLFSYLRGRVFRQFIPRYTDDHARYAALVEELDRFKVVVDSTLFASYINVQKEEIDKMNKALTKREQQLLEAQAVGQVGSFEWDLADRRRSLFTPQMFRILEVDDLTNLIAFLEDVHPDDREKVKKAFEKALNDGDYECEYRYLINGKEKILFTRGKVQFEDGAPARMIGTTSDLTERHRIIQRLEESERLHKQAQALTHIGNWSWMVKEGTISWSDEMYRIYGLAPQSEAITFDRFIAFIHPDDREIRKAEIRRSLETLEVREYYFRIVAADGSPKILRGKGEVVVNSHGEAVGLLGTCQDVTHERTLTEQLKERERYLEQLNHSLHVANHELRRTNEELESFNFIASHDLQEPLRKIQMYSNRILENGLTDLPEKLREHFNRIDAASRRMQKLIEDFLAFSQTLKVKRAPEWVDLNRIVEEIRSELAARVEEKQARISAGPLPRLHAIPFQIKQLMVNLVSNSLKYSHPEKPPIISITGAMVSGSEIQESTTAAEGRYAMISITDNGIGFDPKYRHKIFELFQRLHGKNVYSGTGIGLALCKKIVENLNGYITAEGRPNEGAVFTFYLPVPDSPS